jgi:hypothetical protein
MRGDDFGPVVRRTEDTEPLDPAPDGLWLRTRSSEPSVSAST